MRAAAKRYLYGSGCLPVDCQTVHIYMVCCFSPLTYAQGECFMTRTNCDYCKCIFGYISLRNIVMTSFTAAGVMSSDCLITTPIMLDPVCGDDDSSVSVHAPPYLPCHCSCLVRSSSSGCLTDPPTGQDTLITGYNEASCTGRPVYEIGTSCTAMCQAGSTGGFTTCLHRTTDLTSSYWATHPCKHGEILAKP